MTIQHGEFKIRICHRVLIFLVQHKEILLVLSMLLVELLKVSCSFKMIAFRLVLM
jgi:hypothetical protein